MKNVILISFILYSGMLFGQICGMPVIEVESGMSTTVDCVNPDFCGLQDSNPYYIPDDNSPMIEVKLNLHIIVHESDPDLFPNYVEGDSDHLHFLEINVDRMNNEIFYGSWEGNAIEEKCDGDFTNKYAINSRIRGVINKIVWHSGDMDDYTNNNSICGSHTYDKFIKPFPELYDDALDLIFVENNTGFGGCGPALDGENFDYVIINNSFTSRYIKNANYKEKANLAHELGHSFGLHHPEDFACVRNSMGYGCVVHADGGNYTGNFNQVMHGNSSNQRYFSALEVAQMRRYLLTTWRKKWLAEVPQENETIIINGSETWDGPITWTGDVVIPNGSELTVTSTLRMQKDNSIFVERGARLVINGGTITSCGTEKWSGIRVEGFPAKSLGNGQPNAPFGPLNPFDSGIIAVISDGTIDNAKNGISTNNDHLGWPEVRHHYGGLIHCDDANFTNCIRAVEIMKYGSPQVLDKSFFHRTLFQDMYDGVTNWASDGVVFENCSFKNIEHVALGAHNAAINVVNRNTFDNVLIGIDLVGTKKNQLASVIATPAGGVPNNFRNTYIGIFAKSINNLAQTQIANNKFDATVGVQIEGPSNITCTNNNFSNGLGIVMFDSDNFDNRLNNNQFSNSVTAISSLYDNRGLVFSNNCMEFSQTEDVWIYGTNASPGRINSNQGSNFFEAGNCFSNGVVPKIVAGNTIESFTYFVQNPLDIFGCFVPEQSGDYIIGDATGSQVGVCGTGLMIDPPSEGCDPSSTELDLKNEIAALDSEISYLKNIGGNEYTLNQAERCLGKSLKSLASLYASELNVIATMQYFSQRSEFQYRTVPFERFIDFEDYGAARSYLTGISSTSNEEMDYKESQRIYLDYLEQDFFELSPSDKLHLANTAANVGPLNAYSGAIHYILTGERIPVPVPSRIEERRILKQEKEESEIHITPNPVTAGGFMIHGKIDKLVKEANLLLEIYNTAGQLVVSKNITDNSVLINQSLVNGLHFVRILSNDKVIHQEKVLFLE